MRKVITYRHFIIVSMTILLLAMTLAAEATGPLYQITRPSKMTNKLLRGVLNIPLCVMEIPKSVNKNIKNTDYFTGTFVGLGKGAWKSGKRLGYGVFETVTFPDPELDTLDHWVDDPIPFKELAE